MLRTAILNSLFKRGVVAEIQDLNTDIKIPTDKEPGYILINVKGKLIITTKQEDEDED